MMKNIFDTYPEKIFNPLTGVNQRVYADVLVLLYESFFSDEADLDEVDIKVGEIKSRIKEYLSTEEILSVKDDGITSFDDSKEGYFNSASIIIFNRIVDTGWLEIDRVGFIEIAYMSPLVSELIDFLFNAEGRMSSQVGGDVYSIYLLLDRVSKGSDVNVTGPLQTAQSSSKSILKKMNLLSSHMRMLKKKIQKNDELKEKIRIFYGDFMSQTSFADFKKIRTSNHPFKYRSEILELISNLECEPIALQGLALQISEELGLSMDDANHELSKILSSIRQSFENSEVLLDRLDKEYFQLTYKVEQAIKYQNRISSTASQTFEDALFLLKGLPEEECLPALLVEVSAVGENCLAEIKSRRKPINLEHSELIIDIPREKLVFERLKKSYAEKLIINPDLLLNWVERLMIGKSELFAEEIKINDLQEMVMFEKLKTLGVDAKYHSRFSRFVKRYHVEQMDSIIETPYHVLKNFKVVRK